MTDQEKLKAAIDTIARYVLAEALDYAISHDGVLWEDYGELGEHDFDKIVVRAGQIADSIRPSDEAYEPAYEHLAERAAGEPV